MLTKFIKNDITYETFCDKFPKPSIEFYVDYSSELDDELLGTLSPFIIDILEDNNTALIKAEYCIKADERTLKEYFNDCISNNKEVRDICSKKFKDFLELKIYAINPKDEKDCQEKSKDELVELFPQYFFSAERGLGEGNNSKNTLPDTVSNYFHQTPEELDDDKHIYEQIQILKTKIKETEKELQNANDACGKIEHQNIKEIKKVSNFRSAPKIVNFLNSIRPDLPQYSAIDNFEGDIKVITCNDYSGNRRTDRIFNGDLPVEELKTRLGNLIDYIKNNKISANENIKTLMITHKVLASQQGYNKLLEILGERLKNSEDEILNFFSGTIEPIYKALINKDTNFLFDTLGTKNHPITKKSDRNQWVELKNKLEDVRKQKAIDVIKVAIDSKIIPVPELIFDIQSKYEKSSKDEYFNGTSITNYLNIGYDQFVAAIDFLHPESEFSTEHGVKGEEYDNVIFTISKGWNNYQFDVYVPQIKNDYTYKNDTAYVRNRNLFYVCCSRPRKRLFIFISTIINNELKQFLEQNIGSENIYTYKEYITSLY